MINREFERFPAAKMSQTDQFYQIYRQNISQLDYKECISMIKPGRSKRLELYKKAYTILIISIIFISLQDFIGLNQVEGGVNEDGKGNLIVDAGSIHPIDMKGGTYQQQGNITVTGTGSKLLIRNTTMKFLKGTGFRYNINVLNGGTLEIINSELTVDVSAGGSEENVDINVNSGTFRMINSSIHMPGDFSAVSGNLMINRSDFSQNSKGSIKSSQVLDLNNTNAVFKDSTIVDIKASEHIYLRGNTNFTVINTFLNLTGSHKLQLYDNAHAKLYALSVSEKDENSVIAVSSPNAYAEIFRMLTLHVYDGTDVPVGGAYVTPRNFSNKEMVPPPDAEILDYLEKSAVNYNITNYLGGVILPIRSDNITNSGVDYVGNYFLSVNISTYKTSSGYSLKPFPNFYPVYNTPSTSIKFAELIPPKLNQHYSKLGDVNINVADTLFNAPLQLQQNLIIDGKTLTVSGTTLEINQTKTERFYVLVKNGGVLILDDSVMSDPAGWPLNVYVESGGSIIVRSSTFKLGNGVLNLRGGSSLVINGSTFTGSINSDGPGNTVTAKDSTNLNGGSIVLDDTVVFIKDAKVTASSISTSKLQFTAINSTFNRKLTFKDNTVANITNVTFPGVSSPTISILDTSEVNIFWWLEARVIDGGNNLLEKAMVFVYNYSISGQKRNYDQGETDANGIARFNVFSEMRNASGTFKGIERNYYLNATYRQAKSTGAGTLPLTSNKVMTLEFDLAADLLLESQSIFGNLFAGNMLTINATVKNIGDFDLNTTSIDIRFYVNGNAIGGDEVLTKLGADESAYVIKDWMAAKGTHVINVTIDPDNTIGEKNETNNVATSIVTISVDGPDLGLSTGDIKFDPEVPVSNSNLTVSAKITNYGGYDPADNGDQITVKFYLNDPAIGGSQIGTTQVITSIPPSTSKTVATNWTIGMVGNYNIFVVVETQFDMKQTNNKANRTLKIFKLPDLYISSGEIEFLPSEKLIHESPVFIRATVYNIGGMAVDNVGVAFYDGDPAAGGTQIGFNTSIQPIGPNGGTVIVQIQWIPEVLGTHTIFVQIDPDLMVNESRITNNIANRTIDVLSKPNLYIQTDDISFSKETVTEGEKVTIQALIHNDGEIPVKNVIVRITLNSLSNPSIVPDIEIPSISANGIFNMQVDWQKALPNGTQDIYVWIDPNNVIPESNKLDNHASKSIAITKVIDLRIIADDILLNNDTVLSEVGFGKLLSIKAKIWNDGGSPTKTVFIVQFFLSDPGGDRKLGGDISVISVAAGSFVEIEVSWLANQSGNQMIIVLVDPQGLVSDSNRGNNDAFKQFVVKDPPDILIVEGAVSFSTGEIVKTGSNITISAMIQNRGGTDWEDIEVYFYDGDPDDALNASEQIDMVKLDVIESLGEVRASTVWKADDEGPHDIFIIIDPMNKIPDSDLSNNKASGSLEVISKAPDLYFLNIEHNSNYVMIGDKININITIGNAGNRLADQAEVVIFKTLYTSKTELDRAKFPNIDPGKNKTLVYKWDVGEDPGPHILDFYVDLDNKFKEFNESNNKFEDFRIMVHSEPPSPDLKLEPFENNKYISLDKEPRVGESVKIIILIRNIGTKDSTGFNVTISADSKEFGRKNVPPLRINLEEVITFLWSPVSPGDNIIEIAIDPEEAVNETDESRENNVITERVVVLPSLKAETEDISSIVGTAIAAVVIIVILIALVLIIIIKKKRITDWAECSECQTKMPLDASICPNCGAEFSDEMECGECHALISIDDAKCPNCGALFTEESEDDKKKDEGAPGEGEAGTDDSGLERDEDDKKDEPDLDKNGADKKDEEDGPEKDKDDTDSISKIDDDKKSIPEELDEEEFQEFERELDEDLDDDSGNKIHGEPKVEAAGSTSETKNGSKAQEQKTPVPTPVAAANGGSDKPEKEEAVDKEEKKEEEGSKDKKDDEEKDDFIIPGDQWTAECYKCNARIPLSASLCPECGAEFE